MGYTVHPQVVKSSSNANNGTNASGFYLNANNATRNCVILLSLNKHGDSRMKKQSLIPKERLIELYVDERMTDLEISKIYGCSLSLVTATRKKYGIARNDKFLDITGQSYGRLTAVRRVDTVNRSAVWECRCDCGNTHKVKIAQLRNGEVQSCGCYKPNITHNMSRTRPYRIWSQMKARCDTPSSGSYGRYGKHGIGYTEEWSTFNGFWRDMQSGYSSDLTIERLDVNRGYSPDNCVWATRSVQARNKSNTVRVAHNGEEMCAYDFAVKNNLNISMTYYHLHAGKTPAEVIQLLTLH